MSGGGDSSSSGNDSVSADVEAGLATESMADYSVAEGGTGGDQEEYNTVMEQYGPGKNTSPKTSETYDAGGLDPAVPSFYKAGTKPGDYINDKDTGSNIVNNARANFATKSTFGRASTAISAILNPFSVLGKASVVAAYQTAKFNNAMGRPITQGILDIDGKLISKGTDQKSLLDTYKEVGDSSEDINARVERQVNYEGMGLPEPSKFTKVGSKDYIQKLYDDVATAVHTPRTSQGLLAVSDSPYYDFLKARNLDRRIL
tara:strand:+ start:339 stop:1115 length:777 start_codon:yes stop_codon:yes gene_type:complete